MNKRKLSEEELSRTAKACVRPLADDVELCLAIEQELLQHLEAAFEEEVAEGISAEEALAEAKKRFGNPEELSQELLASNSARLTWRARVRRTIKLAALPILLLGSILCLDLRSLASFQMCQQLLGLNPWKWIPYEKIPKRLLAATGKLQVQELSDENRLLVANFLQSRRDHRKPNSDQDNGLDWARQLYEKYPGDLMYTATYAQKLVRYRLRSIEPVPKPEEWEQFRDVLARGRQMEPENALYDYLEAYAVSYQALKVLGQKTTDDTTRQSPLYAIQDRTALDKAMNIYLQALEKPTVKPYSFDLTDKVREAIKPSDDWLGTLQAIDINTHSKLDSLFIIRELTLAVTFYSDILLAEGKPLEAAKFLESWRLFLPQYLSANHKSLLEVLVCGLSAEIFRDAARRQDARNEIVALDAVCKIIEDFKKSVPASYEQRQKQSGILSHFLYLPFHGEVLPEQLEPERRLTYVMLDAFGLLLFSMLVFLIIASLLLRVGLLRLTGYRPFLLLLSGKAYLRLVGLGVVLPLLFFLAFTYCDFLGGRNFNFIHNWPRTLIGLAFLTLGWPAIFWGMCQKQLLNHAALLGFGREKLPAATRCLNLALLHIVFLAMVGLAFRPLLAAQTRYYVAKDTIICPIAKYQGMENRSINRLASKMLKAMTLEK